MSRLSRVSRAVTVCGSDVLIFTSFSLQVSAEVSSVKHSVPTRHMVSYSSRVGMMTVFVLRSRLPNVTITVSTGMTGVIRRSCGGKGITTVFAATVGSGYISPIFQSQANKAV